MIKKKKKPFFFNQKAPKIGPKKRGFLSFFPKILIVGVLGEKKKIWGRAGGDPLKMPNLI